MDPTSLPPRYTTLRDYLLVMRRNWVAVVLIAAVGAGLGLGDAERQTPLYQATASVSFQDPAENLSLVGLSTSLILTPAELANQNAETLTRPQIIDRVQQNLSPSPERARRAKQKSSHRRGRASPLPAKPTAVAPSRQSLAGGVSGSVTAAGLLEITATWSDPSFAMRLANSVAAVVVAQDNRMAQQSFATAADDIRGQIATLRRSRGASANPQLLILEDELARLDSLSHFAQSAELAQSAQRPTNQTSPKTIRSAVIGLVLGLVLAILLAFIRDGMDRRLRTSHDIEESLQFPILGHVRNKALGKVIPTEALRSDEFRIDLEAFRILRRNIEFLNLDSPPRSLVVTSAVPEEGKTTVAAALAFAMASAGKRTLLIDGDLRRPDLAARLGLEPTPGLTDFLMGEVPSTQITRHVQLTDPPSSNGKEPAETPSQGLSLTVIPAGSPTSHAAELLGSGRFKQLVEQLMAAYDAVVVDSSPVLPVADTLEMLPSVDAVVVCAREAKTRREEALAMRTALERFPERPVGVVVTGVKPARHDYEVYSYSYGYS